MAVFYSKDFGKITVRSNSSCKTIKFKININGELHAYKPTLMPMVLFKLQLKTAHHQINQLFQQYFQALNITKDQPIGKQHYLIISQSTQDKIKLNGRMLNVHLTDLDKIFTVAVQQEIRQNIIKILKKEAAEYLPKRVKILAEKYQFNYNTVKVKHVRGFWGSCTFRKDKPHIKTINLNIALMNLPMDLIDAVILHELAHTKQSNHSAKFWAELGRVDLDYKKHRQQLAKFSPHI